MVKQSAGATGLEGKARVRQNSVEKQKQRDSSPSGAFLKVSAEPAEMEVMQSEAVERLRSATVSG